MSKVHSKVREIKEREREREIMPTYGAFTLDVKLMLNGNLGGILDGTQC
jgi:hypothetical protein